MKSSTWFRPERLLAERALVLVELTNGVRVVTSTRHARKTGAPDLDHCIEYARDGAWADHAQGWHWVQEPAGWRLRPVGPRPDVVAVGVIDERARDRLLASGTLAVPRPAAPPAVICGTAPALPPAAPSFRKEATEAQASAIMAKVNAMPCTRALQAMMPQDVAAAVAKRRTRRPVARKPRLARKGFWFATARGLCRVELGR